MILFLFFRQDLGVETMELMCVRVLVFVFLFFFPLEQFLLICGVGFPPQLPVFGGAGWRGWAWAGGGRRSGRRELRGGARRKEGLLVAPGSLHWLCRPPTSAPAPVGSPGASSRKPSLTSPTQAKQTGVSTFLLLFISTSSSTAGWASWFTALSSAQHSGDSSRVEHGKGDPVPTLWSSLSTQAP